MIFTFISRACSDLPVAVCCRVMKVSTSGFYAWLSQPCSDRDHADAVLTNTIVDIHRMSRRSYGSPRVHAELRLGLGTFCSQAGGAADAPGRGSRHPPPAPWWLHRTHPGGVVHERLAVLDDGAHDRRPAHAELPGQAGHGAGVGPHLAPASHPARSVNTVRAEMCGEASVHVLASQSSSAQRHRRLRHTSRAARPKQARSRISTVLRSCASARTPHSAQPATSATVSMSMTTSASVSITSSTRNPLSPRSASASPVPSFTAGASLSSQPSRSRNDGGAPCLLYTSPSPRDS